VVLLVTVVDPPVVPVPVPVTPLAPPPPTAGLAGQLPGGSGCGLSGQASLEHAASDAPTASVATK